MGIDVAQIDGSWWVDDPKCEELLGPYDTQSEAKQAATGLRRFYREAKNDGCD